MTSQLAAKGRNQNTEILRIISMVMIVAYHYAIMGFYAEDIIYSPNKSFVDIFGMGGKIGTDVFVLISGYYMVSSKFTLKKLLSLMGQIWFYTLGALLVFLALKGPGILSVSVIKSALFPLATAHYWFATYYVLLMLLSPFLNKMMNALDRKEHMVLAVFLFLLCTVMPMFNMNYAAGMLWLFVSLYVTAAYCRKWIGINKRVANACLIISVALIVLCALKICISNAAAQKIGDSEVLVNSVGFLSAYSPAAYGIAVLMLLAFSCREAKQNKFISLLGGLTFGVYLFHSNQLVNDVLYQDIFHTVGYAEHPLLFVHAFVTVLAIYLAGSIVDLLREKYFAPLWAKMIELIFAEGKLQR